MRITYVVQSFGESIKQNELFFIRARDSLAASCNSSRCDRKTG